MTRLSLNDKEHSTFRQGDLCLQEAEELVCPPIVKEAVSSYSMRKLSQYDELRESNHESAKTILKLVEPLLSKVDEELTRSHNRFYPHHRLKYIARQVLMKLEGNFEVQSPHEDVSKDGFTFQFLNISEKNTSFVRLFKDRINDDNFSPDSYTDYGLPPGYALTVRGTQAHAGITKFPCTLLISMGSWNVKLEDAGMGVIYFIPLYDRLRILPEQVLPTITLQNMIGSKLSRQDCLQKLSATWAKVRVIYFWHLSHTLKERDRIFINKINDVASTFQKKLRCWCNSITVVHDHSHFELHIKNTAVNNAMHVWVGRIHRFKPGFIPIRNISAGWDVTPCMGAADSRSFLNRFLTLIIFDHIHKWKYRRFLCVMFSNDLWEKNSDLRVNLQHAESNIKRNCVKLHQSLKISGYLKLDSELRGNGVEAADSRCF